MADIGGPASEILSPTRAPTAPLHSYDGTVRNAMGDVMQFLYGEDGMEGTAIEGQRMEFLRFNRRKFAEVRGAGAGGQAGTLLRCNRLRQSTCNFRLPPTAGRLLISWHPVAYLPTAVHIVTPLPFPHPPPLPPTGVPVRPGPPRLVPRLAGPRGAGPAAHRPRGAAGAGGGGAGEGVTGAGVVMGSRFLPRLIPMPLGGRQIWHVPRRFGQYASMGIAA